MRMTSTSPYGRIRLTSSDGLKLQYLRPIRQVSERKTIAPSAPNTTSAVKFGSLTTFVVPARSLFRSFMKVRKLVAVVPVNIEAWRLGGLPFTGSSHLWIPPFVKYSTRSMLRTPLSFDSGYGWTPFVIPIVNFSQRSSCFDELRTAMTFRACNTASKHTNPKDFVEQRAALLYTLCSAKAVTTGPSADDVPSSMYSRIVFGSEKVGMCRAPFPLGNDMNPRSSTTPTKSGKRSQSVFIAMPWPFPLIHLGAPFLRCSYGMPSHVEIAAIMLPTLVSPSSSNSP
mmetsp:Transcript_39801/g.127278  ORF Transcript_39801/g.127278 Transcript_39801/m.127278 type:complete len:284 (+) Transcript_39801:1849-2700(+)